jgi:hypothetical protein
VVGVERKHVDGGRVKHGKVELVRHDLRKKNSATNFMSTLLFRLLLGLWFRKCFV